MDFHHLHHHENSVQPPPFTAADAPPPSFIGQQQAPPPSHPSYAEMITAAITTENAVGKGGGSSKRAIARFIDQVYTNLPPNHSSLLTHYLKELKHNGYLVMLKNSYQLASVLASSGSGAGVGVNPGVAHTGSGVNLDLNASQVQQKLPGFVDPSPKRRGRPPKVRAESGSGPVPVHENGAGAGSGVGVGVGEGGAQSGTGKKRGRPPKQHVIRPHSSQGEHQIMMEPADTHPIPQPESITDGLGPEDQKRRPGRPSKLTPHRKPAQAQPNGPAQTGEQSDQVLVKRRVGRPKKSLGGGGGGGGQEEEGGSVVVGLGHVGGLGGRPKRSGLGPVSRPIGKRRGRGRPPKVAGVGLKRRGRPPKMGGVGGGGIPKFRRLSASGKAIGRPRKKAANPNHMANEELTKKLDFMQSKIREAIEAIRPYLSHEDAPLMALQQLEELAAPLPQPVMATPISEIPPPMPVNMNVPPPQPPQQPPQPPVTMSGPPPPEPPMSVPPPGPFGVGPPPGPYGLEPFHVPSSFENQTRMSWMSSNEM